MLKTKMYGRIRVDVPNSATTVLLTAPNGETRQLPIFPHQDADFTYDRHGYETVTLRGEPRKQTAFTAVHEGQHTMQVYSGEAVVYETTIEASPGQGGFVEVSKRDPRYFALSDGYPYVPIGLNLVECGYDRLPAGGEHFTASNQTATTGLMEWGRWLRALRDAGGNYARIWLSRRYTEIRTGIMGVHDPLALARFDALIELARENGIKLKLCFEHWRTFSDTSHFAYKYYIDPDTGQQLKDENEWFTSPVWNARWLEDIKPYLLRCQNDPIVFAWELWNENECGAASFESVAGFTERMLPQVKALSPMNMVVNSLGSFDHDGCEQRQEYFANIPDMDFHQVHQYLDQGAPFDICHTDPIEMSIFTVGKVARPDKPLIYTETGAVNDCHVGPFRFYSSDHNGLIFHDTTYPAFFAGAAGSGHIWHWNHYVEPKNLWRHFKPLADVLEGVQVDGESFVSSVIADEKAWILTLTGSEHILVLVRNKADRWDYVIRDNVVPKPVEGLCLPLNGTAADAFWLMDEKPGEVMITDTGICFPPFVHGCVLRIRK